MTPSTAISKLMNATTCFFYVLQNYETGSSNTNIKLYEEKNELISALFDDSLDALLFEMKNCGLKTVRTQLVRRKHEQRTKRGGCDLVVGRVEKQMAQGQFIMQLRPKIRGITTNK